VTPDLLLVSCAAFPDGDEDGPVLLEAVARAGVRAQWRAWDDPSAPWGTAPAVLRATWDYTLRRDEFLAWARSVPRLYNPYDAVLWNSDKIYLAELERAGIPITPTTVIRPGEQVDLEGTVVDLVVKPSVGAGSRGAGRFTDPQAAAHHARRLHDVGRVVLVQPYLSGVDTAGETALIYVDGTFSHAIAKGAMLETDAAHEVHGDALFVPERITPREPSPEELELGDLAMRYLTDRFGTLLYARIDVLPGPDGPVVIEVEVTEPSLFLSYSDGAADRFAAAIAART
jgi:glutathione synthase/RimK-type ligase-like ATP-grasp enzyme